MLQVRRAEDRGPTDFGWLQSRHSFAFGDYRDPAHPGFRDLRVINEDRVAPGAGFGRHGHANMEILSYVLEGALGHRDSTGADGVIRPGEIQRMSAGAGVEHSEMNGSALEPVHFLQIWIQPDRRGGAPGYEQTTLPAVSGEAQLDLIASPEGGPGSVSLRADARVYRASLDQGATLEVPLDIGRHAWVQVARGAAVVNEVSLRTGDGLAVGDELLLSLRGDDPDTRAELLIFDLS